MVEPSRGRLDVDEPAEDVEPGVAAPGLLPQVTRAMADRVGGVAAAAGVAAIERQEPGLRTGETLRHLDVNRVDGEMDERPSAERDIGRIPVSPVLVLCVFDGLMGQRVLQLGCRHGDAVDEETQVDRLRRRGVVQQLARDRQAIGEVTLGQLGRQPMRRLEEGEAHLDAVVVDTMAQDVNGPALVELPRKPVSELRSGAGLAAMNGNKPHPGRRLRPGDEREQLSYVEPDNTIEVGCPLGLRPPLADAVPARVNERGRDRVLEPPFSRCHAVTPATMSPVTAAEISARRRSDISVSVASAR